MVFIEYVEYVEAKVDEWCSNSEEVDGRFRCYTDEKCLENGRKYCDNDEYCFGIMWFKKDLEKKLRICRGTKTLVPKENWRTMMKLQIRKRI